MPEPAPIPNDTPHIADLLSRYDNAASRNEELAVPAEIERRIAGLEAQLAAAREDKQINPQAMLREWHQKFGVTVNDTPTVPCERDRNLRISLIAEELSELLKASVEQDIIEVADAIADLLYVVYGTAVTWGIPADAVFSEVHRSNMTKVWPDGTVRRREDGKVLKPPAYSPADIRAAIDAARKGEGR